MRIRNNISLLNSVNNLSNAVNLQSNSSYKLSSGNRLYSSKSDSAGLSISEKMKAQIRGLGQANRNSQDGISLVQTAEGALEEVHSMLQRMRILSVQSINGTYTDNDRDIINAEVSELLKEINKISDTTEFNKQKLLGGSTGSSGPTTIATYSLDNTALISVQNVSCLSMDEMQKDASPQKVYTSFDELRKDGLVDDNNKEINLSGNIRLENIGKLDNEKSYVIKCAAGTTLTLYNTEITTSDVPKSGITFEGTGNELIIEGSNSIFGGYGGAGINVADNVELTIKGTGTIEVQGGDGGAAIGGSTGQSCGKIVIESGNITVSGGYNGAGIGGGNGKSGGEIIISGGTVVVKDNKGDGAGIGGGANGDGGNVSISGGSVTTTGGYGGAGIGGGSGGSGGSVTISGGSVTSTGGGNGAGIGGGSTGDGGNVEISGGTINITGGENAAGIGGGANGSCDKDKITISGGSGSASGGLNAPGIGAGSGGTSTGTIAGSNSNASMDYNTDKKYEWPWTAPINPPGGGGSNGGTTGGGSSGGNTGGGGTTGGGTGSTNGKGIILQIGANQGNILHIDIDTINTDTLGITKLSTKTAKDAEDSIGLIDTAISKVSDVRSRLGAYMNVLSITTNYLNNTEENMQASQSRIADADYATEALEYARSNILIKAGQAMIAQNKQNTGNVLSLLN